ncbi:MAG: C_GCAxxG_C_C family protein [Firmicutes bacterium]|nr:C_GCAxxG_C_C family protein [Bacillota bacterium]
MSDKADRVVQLHQNGVMHCAQAVLSVYGADLGLDPEVAVKVAAGFGGGMGRSGELCGSVTGALMALGMTFDQADADSREKVFALVRRFIEMFIARNGSIRCRDLLGYDNSTPEGRKAIAEKKLLRTICKKMDRDAAEILEELLPEVR